MSDPNGVTGATAVRSSEPCAAHERQAHLLQGLLRPPTRLSAGAGAQHRRASGTRETFSIPGTARPAGGRT